MLIHRFNQRIVNNGLINEQLHNGGVLVWPSMANRF